MRKLRFFLIVTSFSLYLLVILNGNIMNQNSQLLYNGKTEIKLIDGVKMHNCISSVSTSLDQENNTISINGNDDFDAQALNEGWSGNGSQKNPYVIKELSISNQSSVLISINNTDLFFIIINNTLNGIDGNCNGILLENVTNGVVVNNTVKNCYIGINIQSSDLIIIVNNSILNNSRGIKLSYSIGENSIINNTIDAMGDLDNRYGITLVGAGNNSISNNTIEDYSISGILMDDAHNNTIEYNDIYKGLFHSIFMIVSDNNTIRHNYMHHSCMEAMYLIYSNNNSITNNTILDMSSYGIIIDGGSGNFIERNDLVGNAWLVFNNIQKTQAFDSGVDNTFSHNFWTGWTFPDANPADGIVDEPYHIDGDANNKDSYPTTTCNNPMTPHIFLKPPGFFDPSEGEIIFGNVTLEWFDPIDTQGHPVNFTISYSIDNKSSWTVIADNHTITSYTWDTTTVPDDDNYWLKVVATCSEGLTAEWISEASFIVRNAEHILTTPTIMSPKGVSILNGTILIQWQASTDSWNDSVTYTLYYSTDNGSSWRVLIDNYLFTSYEWNTSTFPDSPFYLLKVVATCSEGLTTEFISEKSFAIRSALHSLETPVIKSPKPGQIVSGIETVRWDISSDSWWHSVSYSLYYSFNNGTNWTLLVDNYNATRYEWNTTTVPNGANYWLKVVAMCSEGLTTEYVLKTPFIVRNGEHSLTKPIILAPTGGEIIKGDLTIVWEAPVDSWNHSIEYMVFYSNNNGTWDRLVADYSWTNYTWDTTLVPNGDNYLIKIIALCSEGHFTVQVLETPFIIQNADVQTSSSLTSSVGGWMAITLSFSVITITIIGKIKRRKGSEGKYLL